MSEERASELFSSIYDRGQLITSVLFILLGGGLIASAFYHWMHFPPFGLFLIGVSMAAFGLIGLLLSID